ncbi:MAG: hypothetical protein PHF25_01915 [Candidatus Margulisbacteria bacterium]|nr:hypothetical protein [Candidatus Margulisiibacteriota bacterium]
MLSKIFNIYFQSWQIVKKNIVFLIGIFGGVYLFLELLTYLSNLAINSLLIGLITSLLNLFFFCLFFLGITKIVVKLSQSEEITIKDLFSQWNLIFNFFVLYLFSIIVFYLLHRFFMFFAVNTGLPDLFALAWLFIVVFIFLLFFSFINFFMVKYQMGPINSFKQNFLVVKKDILAVFVFYLIFLILNLLGLMFFYIGFILTLPITFLAQAIFLDKLEDF